MVVNGDFNQSHHQQPYLSSNNNSSASLSSVFGKGTFKGLSRLFNDNSPSTSSSDLKKNVLSRKDIISNLIPFKKSGKARSTSMSVTNDENNFVTSHNPLSNNLHNPMNYVPSPDGSISVYPNYFDNNDNIKLSESSSSLALSVSSSDYSLGVDSSLHQADILEMYIEDRYATHCQQKQKQLKRKKIKYLGTPTLRKVLRKASPSPQLKKDKPELSTTTCISVKYKSLSDHGHPVKKIGEGASGSVTLSKTVDGQYFAIKLFHTPMTAANTVSVVSPISVSRSVSRRDSLTVSTKSSNISNTSSNSQSRAASNLNKLTTFQKKIIKEYCIGSVLHHTNVMETFDLIIEVGDRNHNVINMIQIMEYIPYDFFNLVMSNRMAEPEIACYFEQLIHGVAYLHSKDIGHLDLKLDNCVVTANGILKIIDFGSAVIFMEHGELKYANGIVGSDPYLSPELLSSYRNLYDPRPVDIWAVAIIYYCMIMRKFPWKAPRKNFNTFRLFSEDPDDEEDVSKGPMRVLRLLPEYSRTLMGKMLEIDVKKRIKMKDILVDPWIQDIHCCDVDRSNRLVHKPENHVHHLVTGEELEEQELQQKEIEIHMQNNNNPENDDLNNENNLTTKTTSL